MGLGSVNVPHRFKNVFSQFLTRSLDLFPYEFYATCEALQDYAIMNSDTLSSFLLVTSFV